MAYDAPAGANNFRYVVRRNEAVAQNIWLEMDKLAGVAWPPASVSHAGQSFTLAAIYRPLGLAVAVHQHEDAIADPLPGACFGDADLDNFQATRMNNPPPAGSTDWHMHAAIVDCHTAAILGIMYDTADRRGFAVFRGALGSNQERILRTTAHELGHALCLYHSDGDAWRPGGRRFCGRPSSPPRVLWEPRPTWRSPCWSASTSAPWACRACSRRGSRGPTCCAGWPARARRWRSSGSCRRSCCSAFRA